ncbi:unnamed protein product [Nippostrongylus brasiliensis]|uniref:Branched-chain amino acid aminotransferase n=1 Tax=Nippostrongylus brasiliensis TaxID=27835 RepID=A0A0N4YTL8_NIPBR|nr:unnamed protein product [Nippostrongylus brasiliensis]
MSLDERKGLESGGRGGYLTELMMTTGTIG